MAYPLWASHVPLGVRVPQVENRCSSTFWNIGQNFLIRFWLGLVHCNHSHDVTSLSLSQRDHIKRLLLYYFLTKLLHPCKTNFRLYFRSHNYLMQIGKLWMVCGIPPRRFHSWNYWSRNYIWIANNFYFSSFNFVLLLINLMFLIP